MRTLYFLEENPIDNEEAEVKNFIKKMVNGTESYF